MEDCSHILAHKTDRGLFVRLTTTPKGLRQWEFVGELDNATRFKSIHQAEEMQRQHRCPHSSAIPREYVRAHTDWLNSKDFPAKRETQREFL